MADEPPGKVVDLRDRMKKIDYLKSMNYAGGVERIIGNEIFPLMKEMNDITEDIFYGLHPNGHVFFDLENAKLFRERMKDVFDSFIETLDEEIEAGGFI